MRMTTFTPLAAGLSALLVAQGAHAETQTEDFEPETTFRANEFPWESAPLSFGAVTLSMRALVSHDVTIDMDGEASYDFDREELTFVGDPDDGSISHKFSLEVHTTISVNPLGDFEFGPFTSEHESKGTFTPFLLEGASQRPFGLDEPTRPRDLVERTFNLGPVPVAADIDYSINVHSLAYQSTEIVLSADEDVDASLIDAYTEEGDEIDFELPNATPGQSSEFYATLRGTFSAQLGLILHVKLTAEIFGQEVDIDHPFEFNFPVNRDEPVEFDPERLIFTVPAEPEPEPAKDDAPDDSGTVDPGSLPAETGDPQSGCGCSASDTTTGEVGFMALFALFGLTRTRRLSRLCG